MILSELNRVSINLEIMSIFLRYIDEKVTGLADKINKHQQRKLKLDTLTFITEKINSLGRIMMVSIDFDV